MMMDDIHDCDSICWSELESTIDALKDRDPKFLEAEIDTFNKKYAVCLRELIIALMQR